MLLVLFTSLNFGVCAALLSAAGGKPPCCVEVAPAEASFTVCCTTGQPTSSELPTGVQTQVPPTSEIVFGINPQTSPNDLSPGHSFADIPYRSVDPQALLSTFLI